MRKNLIFFVSLLSILTLFSACEDSDMAGLNPSLTIPQVSPTYNLSVNKTQLSVPRGASTASFSITSNDSWTVSCDKDWISLTPKQGSGNGEVSVSVTENSTKAARTATIKVTGKQSKTVEITVRQETQDVTLSVNLNQLSVPDTSSVASFIITSNDTWTVSCDQAWLSFSPTQGSGDSEVSVRVTENSSPEVRTATITVTGKQSKSVEITVHQDARNVILSVNVSQLSVPDTSSDVSFFITSNVNWSVSCNQTWISLSPVQGTGNGEVSVSVATNNTKAERTATIIVKGDQGKTVEVLVRQDAHVETVTELVDGKEFASLIKNISTGGRQNYDASNNTIEKIVFEVNSSATDGTIVSSPLSPTKVYANYTSATKTLTIRTSAYKIETPKNFSCAFNRLYKLSQIVGIECLDTRNTEDMSEMFSWCSVLSKLDLSSFVTTKVRNMSNMFYGCSALTSLGISKLVTISVTNMESMFGNCSSLTSLNVSAFNTAKVQNMYGMFSGCSNLSTLDVSNFITKNVTNMKSIFSDCKSMTNLNLGINFVIPSGSISGTFANLASQSRSCTISCCYNTYLQIANEKISAGLNNQWSYIHWNILDLSDDVEIGEFGSDKDI